MKVLTKRSAALNRKPTLEIINKTRIGSGRGKPRSAAMVVSQKKTEIIRKVLKNVAKEDPNITQPKKRGRPPLKNKENIEKPNPVAKPNDVDTKPSPKKRGRKPKSDVGSPKKTETIPKIIENVVPEPTPKPSPSKRRGRKKAEPDNNPTENSPQSKSNEAEKRKKTKPSSNDQAAIKPKPIMDKTPETNNNVSNSKIAPAICRLVEKTPRKYQCGVCEKNFLGSNDLRKHLRIHSDERPYECPHCNKRFRQAGCLKNHIASQHGTDTVYTCDYCNKGFPIKERLRLHIRIHSGEKPYRCEFCPKSFARGGQLTQHLVTHTGEKKFKCDYCEQRFSSAANLRLHQKTHLDERDFTCHLCGKGFYRPDALKKHIVCYHQGVRAFHCKICNKKLKGHLPQHKRTHKHIKKHGCSTCGATFSQRSQLVVHQRIHSGERPYRCQVCWQAFAHSSVLKLHIRKHTGEKPFKCPICVGTKLGFSQLPHLKKHLKSIHGQDKPYMCEVCNEFFKTKLEIQQHSYDCIKEEVVGSVEELIERTIRLNSMGVEPPMPITRMRLLIAILLKKISTEDRLRQLGYEKCLIDNVLIDSLKCAGRTVCEQPDLSEAQRLKLNVQEFLEWTVPSQYMENFKKQHRSTEEILEELTN